jgi:hypothetical protein
MKDMLLKASRRKSFKIEIFPHLKKFIQKNYHHDTSQPIYVDEHSTFGKLITLALRDSRSWKEFDSYHEERKMDTITIVLTLQQSYLSARQYRLRRLNIDLDKLFKENLVQWIRSQMALGSNASAACRSFLAFYDLSESEFSQENAYKVWQRDNDKKQKKDKLNDYQ